MDVIPRWADKYRGIPFAENGYDRDGLHCWGLCRLVYQEQLGIELPRYPFGAYETLSVARAIRDGQAEWRKVCNPQAFDLVLIRPVGRSAVWHVGVMASAKHCLHIEEGAEVNSIDIDNPFLAARIASFHRHPARA